MAKKKNFSAPVSTLSGSSFPNFLAVTRNVKVDNEYKKRFFISKLFSLAEEPFRWIENLKYNKKIENTKIERDPVFIVGHWRSGTTYLHNLMTQDPQMSYVTTYNGIFPNQLLSGKWLFRNMMRLMMPRRRAADNVELGVSLPQEEEFAIGNINPFSFYNFWFFPKYTKAYCNKYILGEGMSEQDRERWKRDYLKLVKKATLNIGNPRFISKNPPHTGRIDLLLELFPNAKFIHIYRNPISVYRSTVNFFSKTIGPLKFQDISKDELEENVLYVYKKLMLRFEEQKGMIPPENFIEIKYEDFSPDPMPHIQRIYEKFDLGGWDEVKDKFEAYVHTQKKFQTNKHSIEPESLQKVKEHWGFAIEKYGYDLPHDVDVLVS